MVLQRRIAAAVFVALIAATTLVAWAVSSNSRAATPKVAAHAAARGPAVDVWDIVPIGAPNQTAPQIPSGVKAAFRNINANGGIGPDHQRVVVKVCNTQGTPNGELQCAQQAASDRKAIATVGNLIVANTAAATAVFQKAGLPAINPFTQSPADFTAKINFPLFAPNFTAAGCGLLAPKAAHVKSIGFASLSLPISIDEANTAVGAAQKAGFKVTGQVQVPLTTTDVSPYVQQLEQNNPQFSVLLFDPELVSAWLANAAQIGKSGPVCFQDGLVSYQTLVGLGSNASNVYAAAFLPDPSWKEYPLLAQFRAQAAAEVKAGDSSASLAQGNDPLLVLEGWIAAEVVPQVGSDIKGKITRKDFLRAINKATVTFGPRKGAVLPPIDFGKPNPIKQYSRLFNTSLFLKKWNVAKKAWVRVSSQPTVNGDKLIP